MKNLLALNFAILTLAASTSCRSDNGSKSSACDTSPLLQGPSCVENPKSYEEQNSCGEDKQYLLIPDVGKNWELTGAQCPEGYEKVSLETRNVGVPMITGGRSGCAEANIQFLTCSN